MRHQQQQQSSRKPLLDSGHFQYGIGVAESDVSEDKNDRSYRISIVKAVDFFQLTLPRILSNYVFPWRKLHLVLNGMLSPNLQRMGRTHSFWDGVNISSDRLWPVVLSVLLLNDFVNYSSHSDVRYENTLAKIFFGFSDNENYQYGSLAANLGANSVWKSSCWTGMALLYTAFLLSGSINLALHSWHRRDENISAIQALNSLEWHLLWNPQLGAGQRTLLITKIIQIYGDANPISKCRMLLTLSKVYDLTDDQNLLLPATKTLTDISQYNYHHLYQHPADIIPMLLANYQQWVRGKLPLRQGRFLYPLFYLVVLPLQLLAKWHLLLYPIRKFYQHAQFHSDKNDCNAKNLIWAYVKEIGRYACVACQLDFVDYQRALTGDDCLTALLSSQRDIDVLINTMNKLTSRFSVKLLDLSQQDWQRWSEADLSRLFNLLAIPALSQFTSIQLANELTGRTGLLAYAIEALSNYLGQSQVVNLDVRYQSFNRGMFSYLLQGLNGTHWRTMSFSQAMLDDNDLEAFAHLNLLNVSTFDISGNAITAYGFNQLARRLSVSPLRVANFSDNDIQLSDLSGLHNLLTNVYLKVLDISAVDLSFVNITALGELLASSSLHAFYCRACQLSDALIEQLSSYLSLSSISELDLSGNPFAVFGLDALVNVLPSSAITRLDLSSSELSDRHIEKIANVLRDSHLSALILENNVISGQGAAQLFAAAVNSSLSALSLADNPLSEHFDVLMDALKRYENCLNLLNINRIGLTESYAVALLEVLAKSQLTHLSLSGNRLGAAIGLPLAKLLRAAPITTLDIRDAANAFYDFNSFLSALTTSSLQWLNVEGIPLWDEQAVSLSLSLVDHLQNPGALTEVELDQDFARALQRVQATTPLQVLVFSSLGISETSLRALCRIRSAIDISMITEQLPTSGCQLSDINIDHSSRRQLMTSSIISSDWMNDHRMLAMASLSVLLWSGLCLDLNAVQLPSKAIAALASLTLAGMIFLLLNEQSDLSVGLMAGAYFLSALTRRVMPIAKQYLPERFFKSANHFYTEAVINTASTTQITGMSRL